MKTRVIFVLLLAATICCLTSCETERSEPVRVRQPAITLQIILFTQTDTLRFLPGDSALWVGYVAVKDDAGHGVPGVWVSFSNTQDSVGHIEPSGDTTDADGHANFIYAPTGRAGRDTICVRAEDVVTCASLVIPQPPHFPGRGISSFGFRISDFPTFLSLRVPCTFAYNI